MRNQREEATAAKGIWYRPVSVGSVSSALLKLGLAVGLVWYLVRRGDIAWPVLRASLAEWQFTVPALLLLFLSPVCQLVRWQSLLRATGVRLSTFEVLSCVMVSKFLNMMLPGYIGGDVLRGLYISRRATRATAGAADAAEPVPASAVAPSIVFDRVAGLLPLLLFSLIATAMSADMLPRTVLVPISLLCAGGLAGALILFLLAYGLHNPPRWMLRLSASAHVASWVSALFNSAHHYVRNSLLMAIILGVSLVSQGLTVISVLLLGVSLGLHLPAAAYFAMVPLGLMVTAIPISPAGLGVGHVAFLALFKLVGSTQGANLFTLYMTCCVVVNLTGAVLLPAIELRAPLPARPAALAEKDLG